MGKIYSREQISKVIEKIEAIDIINSIEEGFVAYSQGKVVVPPVGELIFKDPPGESHIKYGYIIGDEYYVIKIAAGFYENSKLGLPTNSGYLLLMEEHLDHLSDQLMTFLPSIHNQVLYQLLGYILLSIHRLFLLSVPAVW